MMSKNYFCSTDTTRAQCAISGKGNSVPDKILLGLVLSFMGIISAEINCCSTASQVWSCWACAQSAPGEFPSGLAAFPTRLSRMHTGSRAMHKVNSLNSGELTQELKHTDHNVHPNELSHNEGKGLPFLPVWKTNTKVLLYLKSVHS